MTGFNSKRDAAADKLQEPVVKVVSTAPKHIWLDIGFDPQDEAEVAFHELYDVTWSEDNASGYGIEYVRADITPPQPAQEPVAEVIDGVLVKSALPEKYTGHLYTIPPQGIYYTPPQREWVGLTPEETSGFTQHEMTVVKYVSKVLQEKNA